MHRPEEIMEIPDDVLIGSQEQDGELVRDALEGMKLQHILDIF